MALKTTQKIDLLVYMEIHGMNRLLNKPNLLYLIVVRNFTFAYSTGEFRAVDLNGNKLYLTLVCICLELCRETYYNKAKKMHQFFKELDQKIIDYMHHLQLMKNIIAISNNQIRYE